MDSIADFRRGQGFESCTSPPPPPKKACSTKNNIPFPLFYLRGKWTLNSFEIGCWQAKHNRNVTLELPFSLFSFLRQGCAVHLVF